MYKHYPSIRYEKTLSFLKKHVKPKEAILDLGVSNPFSKIMQESGFKVINTKGEDLDENFSALHNETYDVLTAFEIFEHMLNPYTVLKNVRCNKLVATIPMRLWYSPAYRSKTDLWDRHYHEFEDWQFDWLLEKAGWKIIDRAKWANPGSIWGFRPILRRFTMRYYAVYAERIEKV
jgi:hypothetical protein